MFVSLLLLTIAILIFHNILKSIAYNQQNNKNIIQALPFSPANTILLFDLHGVIFKHDYKKMIKTFWYSNHRWPLLKNMFNPCLIWDIVKLFWRKPIPESFFMHLSYHYKDIKEALPLLIKIANCQQVNHPVIAILKQLKKEGYELAVLSNIGQIIFKDLEPRHPEIFSLFDNIMVATPETNYISKPNPKIYKRLQKEINHNKKYIILIDDKSKNLIGGAPFHIFGIRFTTTAKLKERLHQIGVLK